jgi:hypothetical protein
MRGGIFFQYVLPGNDACLRAIGLEHHISQCLLRANTPELELMSVCSTQNIGKHNWWCMNMTL